jgi:hypothetical protein
MLLGSDRSADSGAPSHDEQGSGRSGNAGTEFSWPMGPAGWRGALRPGNDHAEPAYAPPVRVAQCRPLTFLKVFYPRSLISQ